MALASGVLVATAVVDLLPEAYELAGGGAALEVGITALAGYLAFTLVEAFLHQASFEHAQGPGGSAGPGTGPPKPILAVLPPASLIVHGTLDGLAIGFGFQAGADVGLVVLLAVLAHDFADGLNVVTLALDAARGVKLAVLFLVLDALAPLVGAGLSLLIRIDGFALGLLLAWFAGAFIAIGAGHLLPEAQHHNARTAPFLVAMAAVGAAIVLAVNGFSA